MWMVARTVAGSLQSSLPQNLPPYRLEMLIFRGFSILFIFYGNESNKK